MLTSEVVIAIDVGGTSVIWEAHTKDGVISQRSTSTMEAFAGGRGTFIGLTQLFLDEIMTGRAGVVPSVVVVGVPGTVSASGEEVMSCPNLSALDGVELKNELQVATGIRVDVHNDVNLAALGEYVVGAAQEYRNVACVLVGTGVGCGLVINGTIYTGDRGIAGEFGHTIIVPGGTECSCGRRGCLEMYCSGKAFSHAASDLLGESSDEAKDYNKARRLFEMAASGHAGAADSVRNGFSLLGLALANLANLFDPGVIVLGGGLLSGAEWTWSILNREFEANYRSNVAGRPALRRSALGGRAVTAGGAIQGFLLIGG